MESYLDTEYRLSVDDLVRLFQALSSQDYHHIGPLYRDGAIMLEPMQSFDDLALGYVEVQGKGNYKLTQNQENGYFQYTVGPQSFKKYLHPPRRKLWSADGSNKKFEVAPPNRPHKMAFWGVRSCDIAAIQTLDKVFLSGAIVNDWYKTARKDLFIIAVGCTHPSQNCFCTSVGSGPMPQDDFDLALIEIKKDQQHFFLAKIGSQKAHDWITTINCPPASNEELKVAQQCMEESASRIPVRFDPLQVAQTLKKSPEHPQWEDVASRCLSCANCTMVCPTCFCSTTEDITDITGEHTERWLSWDSCFTGDFSFIHGGQIRTSTKSRYRQWMTHKLSNWYDQFGSSGCVGCGRCIAWCPVGIDITEELLAIGEDASKKTAYKKTMKNEEDRGHT